MAKSSIAPLLWAFPTEKGSDPVVVDTGLSTLVRDGRVYLAFDSWMVAEEVLRILHDTARKHAEDEATN